MKLSKSMTIHLTENDVKEIIAEYIKTQKGYSITADDVTLKVGVECHGYGMAEHDVTVFKGCDVDVKEEI